MYFGKLIERFVETLGEQDWMEIETTRNLSHNISVDNVNCLLKFLQIASRKHHLLNVILSPGANLFESLGKALTGAFKVSLSNTSSS